MAKAATLVFAAVFLPVVLIARFIFAPERSLTGGSDLWRQSVRITANVVQARAKEV